MRASFLRVGRTRPLVLVSGLLLLLPGVAEAQWTPTADLPGGPIYSLVAGGGNLFVEAYGDDPGDVDVGIFRSGDHGETWTSADSGLPKSEVIYSPVFCGGRLFAGTLAGGFRSSDTGASWTALDIGTTLPDPVHFLPVGGRRLFAIKGNPSVLLRSDDCGDTWFFQNPLWPEKGLIDVVAISGGILLAGARPESRPVGDVYRSSDNGAIWSVATTGLPTYPQVTAFAVIDSQVLAVVSNQGIFRSSDQGLTWSAANTGLNTTNVISLAVAGDHLFAGTYSSVFHSSDQGQNWEQVGSGLPDGIRVSHLAATESDLFLGTLEGRVWKRPLSEITASIRQAGGRSNGSGFEGNPGAILRRGASIPFSIGHGGEVEIGVFDMRGTRVRTLLKSNLGAGRHRTVLEAGGLSGGIYLMRLQAHGITRSRRFVLEN